MEYTERLRFLALNDLRLSEMTDCALELGPHVLDPKTAALVQIAALIAVGGAVPSYGALADTAVDNGATAAEIVDVLVEVISVVGLPRVVAAAPTLALALGYDTDEAFERPC
jgi:alkylhydroperoxidase/carboxymuconolactone decarboxylase family protein YurZ